MNKGKEPLAKFIFLQISNKPQENIFVRIRLSQRNMIQCCCGEFIANFYSKYRDSVFRSYFDEPIRLLSLCNAILYTHYSDSSKLHINALEGLFFDKQKNDISCTIDDHFLVLIEHQSTVNENMPFRCLQFA